jgi:hypothetical protein
VGKEIYQPKVRESGLSTESTEDKEKPAWQVQREEAMAKLDREAELNRQREARLWGGARTERCLGNETEAGCFSNCRQGRGGKDDRHGNPG